MPLTSYLADVFNFNSKQPLAVKKEPDETKLSYAFMNLEEMDPKLLPENTEKITALDLTENNFTGQSDLRFLFGFPNLTTLILDKNQIQSKFLMPSMPKLTTLWVNHNKIDNLVLFVESLQKYCPNLNYLSMMNNKAAPSYFNGGSLVEYNDFRLYTMSKLSKLQAIDHNEITAEERVQSQAIYGTGRLAKFNEFSVQDQLKRRRSTLGGKSLRKLENSKLEKTDAITKQNKTRRISSVVSTAAIEANKLAERTGNAQEIQMTKSEAKDLLLEEAEIEGNESSVGLNQIVKEIDDILNFQLIQRPPSPSLSLLNQLERTDLAPELSSMQIQPPPPPIPPHLFA